MTKEKKLKNKTKTINVDGHTTQVVNTNVIKLGEKTFPSIRAILLPPSFVIQEIQKMQNEKNLVSLATLNAWLFIFGSRMKPRKVREISKLLSKKDWFLENDSFYETLCLAGLSRKKPIDRMIEFAEKIKGTLKISPTKLSCEVKNGPEVLNQTIKDFIDFYIFYIKTLGSKKKKENLKKAIKKAREEYFKNMRKRFPDQKKRSSVLQNIGERVEDKMLYIQEEIANKFAEKLKKYASKNELKLFNLLYTRQNFLGNRIIRHDLETGLINPKGLNLISVLILAKIYKVKINDKWDFEKGLKFIIENYLIVVENKRLLLSIDERNKKAEQRIKVYETSLSDLIEKKLSSPDDIEKNYEQKELKEKIKKFVKEELSGKEKQIYEMFFYQEMSQEEVAKKIGCSQPYISKVLKTIKIKFRKSGLTKDYLDGFC